MLGKSSAILQSFKFHHLSKPKNRQFLKLDHSLQFIMQVIKLLFLPEHYQSNKAVHVYHVTDIMTNDTTEKFIRKTNWIDFFSD